MSIYSRHKSFFNQPIRLNREEILSPDGVIRTFCNAHHLYEIRQHLWNLVETAISTENELYEEAEKRSALLFFYGQLEEVIEAVYVKERQDRATDSTS